LQYLLTGNIHEAAAVERSQKSQIANKILEIGNLAMNLVDHNYVKEHPDTKRKLSTCTQSLLGCDLGAIKISGIIYKYVANQILYGTISLGSQNVVALAKTNLFRHQSAVNIYGAVNDELKKHEFSNADNFKDICLLRARYNIEITTFNYLMGTSSLQDAINLKVNFNKSKNDQKPTSFDDKMLFVTRSLVAINESMTMVCQSINLNKKELQEAERSGEIEKMELSQEELNIATQCCKWHSTISKTIEHINYQHENRLDNAKIVRQKKIESIARKFSNAQEAKISWQQNKKPEDCSIEAKNMAKLKKSCEEWSKHRDVIDKLQQQFKNTFCSLKLEHQELLMNKADSQRFLSFDSPAPQRVISEALEYQDLPSSKSVKNPRIKELPLFLQNR
jgi:hypothetical protein